MNLSTTIKSIQDIMRKDDGVDGDAQRIGQLTWMLFLKIYDQREDEWEDDAKDKGKRFKSVLPKESPLGVNLGGVQATASPRSPRMN